MSLLHRFGLVERVTGWWADRCLFRELSEMERMIRAGRLL